MSCRLILLVLRVLFDFADFLSDWLFFGEMKHIQPGLVYGPTDDDILWAMLGFCLVGTIFFIMEVIFNVREYRGLERAPIGHQWLSFIVLWFEDIPQILISFFLALCREEAISFFQLTKAAVILLGVFVHLAVVIYTYFRKERHMGHKVLRVLIVIGMLLEAGFAVAIFILSQTESDGKGGLSFKVPNTAIDEVLDGQKYFANVSIFAHYATIFGAGALDRDKADSVVNWLRVTSLNNIQMNREVALSMEYETTSTGQLKMVIWEKRGEYTDPQNQWALTECYTIDQQTANITVESRTTCSQLGFMSNPSIAYIRFYYVLPDDVLSFRKRVFGDIRFNMKLLRDGGCQSVVNYTDSLKSSHANNIPLVFHYYRTRKELNVSDIHHLLYDPDSGGAPRFFRNDQNELTDITQVWKTGWTKCPSTGNLAPALDTLFKVDCRRT